MNISLLKKSELDTQTVETPGYKYSSTTVKSDETTIAGKAISWWGWAQIAKAVSSGFSDWSADNKDIKTLENNNSTQIASEQIAADTAIKTLEAAPVQ